MTVEKLPPDEHARSLQLTTLASRDKPPSQRMCLVDWSHSRPSCQGIIWTQSGRD